MVHAQVPVECGFGGREEVGRYEDVWVGCPFGDEDWTTFLGSEAGSREAASLPALSSVIGEAQLRGQSILLQREAARRNGVAEGRGVAEGTVLGVRALHRVGTGLTGGEKHAVAAEIAHDVTRLGEGFDGGDERPGIFFLGGPEGMRFGHGETDKGQTSPVRRAGTVVVLGHVHVGVRVADGESASGTEYVALGLPPAQMSENDAFDHAPG